jgi:hypothetical protein
VSCIAAGSDSIFAVLELGGRLVAVQPSTDYRASKVKTAHAPIFDEPVTRASDVATTSFESAKRTTYEAANRELPKRADNLVAAFWDGTPLSGKDGGTANTVIQAREAGITTHVVWPDGATRRG